MGEGGESKCIKLINFVVPDKEQETVITKSIGCNRFVYNHFLAKRKEAYEEYDAMINYKRASTFGLVAKET